MLGKIIKIAVSIFDLKAGDHVVGYGELQYVEKKGNTVEFGKSRYDTRLMSGKESTVLVKKSEAE
jgi:hypothetical protein